jgi:hypothetical protein
MLEIHKFDLILTAVFGLILAGRFEEVRVSGQEKPETVPTMGYLSIVVKLGPCRSCVLIEKANQVPGRLVVRQVRSFFIYEITRDGKSVFVGNLPDDPLVVRGFSPPSKQGESVSKSDSATVLMSIPNVDLNNAVGGQLALRVYQAKPGFNIEHTSVEELAQLKSKNLVSLEWELTPNEFANQAKRSANSSHSQQ